MRSSCGKIPDISVRGIVKRYGSVVALNDVELDINGGEFVTLLGPSGSGKSTLLMVLAGFVRPDAGDVRLGDRSIIQMPPHRRNIGMVFQKHALFPHKSVFENIAFPLRLRHIPRDEIESKVANVLALVQLSGYGQRRIDQLSGGQSQRVAVARAIVFSPRILLMDEPLSSLDKNLREQLQIEIRSLHENLGLTTVYVTHDQREALTMSDRVAVMNHGRISQIDTPRRLYERPANSFVANFIGEAILLPVDVDPDGPSVLGVQLTGVNAAVGYRRVFLVLRPGMVEICLDDARRPDSHYFAGVVTRCIYEGESTLYQVSCGPGVTVPTRRLANGQRFQRGLESGQNVMLRLHRDDVLLVPEAVQ